MLIPEQISALREMIRREKEVMDKHEGCFKNMELIDTTDFLRKKNLLLKNEYLKSRVVDKIAVGTKFTMKFFGEKAVNAILVDEDIDFIDMDEQNYFVSKDSKLGQMLLGKKAGESIGKVLDDGNSIFLGTILNIATEEKDYVNFIRAKKRYSRESVFVRRDLHLLDERRKENAAAQEEWEKRHMLTESQYQLLKEKVVRMGKENLNNRQKQDLYFTRQLLNKGIIAPLPEDETIGIGTEFSVTLSTKDGLRTKRVEMVNEAFSDELDDEYVERISPLGNQVFGLKEGDTFSYRSTILHSVVEGIVFDIDNEKKRVKTNSAIVYHTRNVKKGGLVKGQVEMLETELEYRRKILEMRKKERKKEGFGFMSNAEIDGLKLRIAEISKLLTEKSIIENPNSDVIDIGSSFRLSLNYGDDDYDEMKAVLVEKFVSHEASSEHFVSMETEMGQAIYGKKEGEHFSYPLPTGTTITGKVLEIEKTNVIEKSPLQKGR